MADAVTLATIHSAKGLEWDAVFVAGMHEKMMPINQAQTPAEIEEERRLLYVAMTRARDELTVSWASAREPGGRANRGQLAVPGARSSTACPASPAPRRERSKRNRAALHCRECGTRAVHRRGEEDRPLRRLPGVLRRGALRAAARVAPRARRGSDSVPAFVVFTDATLQLIAEHAPADEKGLRAISGVGPGKLAKYGDEVLALVSGSDVRGKEFSVIPIKWFAPDRGQGLAFPSQQPAHGIADNDPRPTPRRRWPPWRTTRRR